MSKPQTNDISEFKLEQFQRILKISSIRLLCKERSTIKYS